MRSLLKKCWATLGQSFLIALLNSSALAWSALAHQWVADRAFQSLGPACRAKALALAQIPVPLAPQTQRFYNIAAWADRLRFFDGGRTRAWHFINIPWCTGSSCAFRGVVAPNIVTAIEQQRLILKNSEAPMRDRAMALRFLVHLVADAHQPLHCMERYHAQFPLGDRGGNLFPVRSTVAKNLHGFWDEAGGLFSGCGRGKKALLCAEEKIRSRLHAASPALKTEKVLDPEQWVQESHKTARRWAYRITPESEIEAHYAETVQQHSAERLDQAARRLAQLMEEDLGCH